TFAGRGFRVLGFDIDAAKVALLRRGESYIQHIPPAVVREMREHGFDATDDFARLGEPDAILNCVPTPLTDAREPDMTYLAQSAASCPSRRWRSPRPARSWRTPTGPSTSPWSTS